MANRDIIQEGIITELYNAFMTKYPRPVLRLCGSLPEGPLHTISLHNDTILHMAAQSKQKDLVLKLLKMLPEDLNHRLADIKNNDGNTILHEVATSNNMISVAEELLRRDENLLFACNDLGEKPIFCAARYGEIEMFKFLAEKMGLERKSGEESKAHLQRNDGKTVLHISIASECFDLALFIVERYQYLIQERDQFSMTAFQYIACNQRSERKRGFMEQPSKSYVEMTRRLVMFIKEHRLTTLVTYSIEVTGLELFCLGAMCCKIAIMRKSEVFNKLLMHLISNTTSWHANINSPVVGRDESKKEPKIKEDSSKLSQEREEQNSRSLIAASKYKKSDESPLFLATISNFKEIVERILLYQPQLLMHTNKEGMNILQVAILYRHIDIFDMVIKSEVHARRLLSAIDKEGNSVLHMVSQKRKGQTSEKVQSPALQLRDELVLFEKVKSASKMLVSNPLNKDNKTAEELFAASNEELHQQAKEWLMRTTENCTIVSVFIATVAFAAAYTVPGGPNQDTGIPILHSNPFFLVFIIADVISLTLALTSVGIFLSILTSSFPLEDFKTYLFRKLKQGIICLVLSVSMMAVAFGATIVLIMKHNGKIVVWDVVAFLPVPIFFLSYSPIRSAVLEPCIGWFVIFVFAAMTIFIFLLPYGAFKGLHWTLKKAYDFICKTVSRISCKKSPAAPTQV